MYRLVLRPALAFLTFLLVVLAVLQVSGRVGMALAHRLQPAVNELLASRQIVVPF